MAEVRVTMMMVPMGRFTGGRETDVPPGEIAGDDGGNAPIPQAPNPAVHA
jgi:hypothetical protein